MNSLIKTKHLFKTFKTPAGEVKAVADVNLEVRRGEFLAIMGPSGSGKTTLLNLLGGLELPTAGEVYFEGRAISELSSRRKDELRVTKIGFIFQTFNLISTLKAWENVALPGLLVRAPRVEREERAKQLLKEIGLLHRFQHYPSELSAGEQQRVAIARALFNQPLILLADEPTGNLDSKTKEEIVQVLKRVNLSYGTSVLIVTHDIKVAKAGRQILKMIDGKLYPF